jgi:hypothetical protein
MSTHGQRKRDEPLRRPDWQANIDTNTMRPGRMTGNTLLVHPPDRIISIHVVSPLI